MSDWQIGRVEANGLTLQYTRTGGNKPPMIMAHGITDMGIVWTRTALALADLFDIFMLDARGHGYSDKPETGYAIADYAADMAGLIDALQLDTPLLLGHSLGAATVAAVAASYPHLVSRLVLEDPPWRAPNEPSSHPPGYFSDRIARFGKMTRDEIIASGQESNPGWDSEEFAPWSLAKTLVSPYVATGGPLRFSWQDQVPRISCPTLLLTGSPAAGAIVTPAVAEEITGLNPHVKIAYLAGAGHNIRRDRFERYIEVVREFVTTGDPV